MSWRRTSMKVLFLGMGFLLVSCGIVFAQGTSGTITGLVTDQTGAVIPNATVTILNQKTGVDYHLTTNSAGVYYITSVIPGTYTVTVTAKGFRKFVNANLELTTDQTLRVDVKLEVGAETQIVTVEAAAPLVNTEQGSLSALVSGSQVQNMPLNGRNIYELMQLIPGAVNSVTVDLEQTNGGSQTNVNGARANFNGFLLDGVANKGLSGGSNAQPPPDFVQEFRIMTNNFSAQYGNSAGSITDVSIKSGTNAIHGSAWEYFRNDKLNARNFFADNRPEWRQNQFGASIGGPIKKDRMFFFGGYEGERFRTGAVQQYTVETPLFRQAVQSTLPNSVASLLYKNFPAPTPTSGFSTVDDIVNGTAVNDIGANVGGDYFGDGSTNTLISDAYMVYTDPCFLNQFMGIGNQAYPGGPAWSNAQTVANRFASLMGVTAQENAQIQSNIASACPGMGLVAPGVQTGSIARSAFMTGLASAAVPTRTQGVFYNGDQYTGRIDYQGDKLRVFGRFIEFLKKDPNNTTATSQVRGFYVPQTSSFPSAAASIVYSFSPTLVNEFRAGYTRNQLSLIPSPSQFGVPTIGFDTGDAQFGAYNGYPQFFIENVYNYSDMLAIVKGKHSIKVGGEVKRNLENSEFNVGRASYYFFDQLWFAADTPYDQNNGVNPELVSGKPAHLDTNIRAWRNYELGFYVQDDWKVKKNLTFNLGLRWDYFSPHTEKYGKVTNFNFAPGSNAVQRLADINCQVDLNGTCALPVGDTQTPNGGFVVAKQLFKPDRNNFSPRVGFAWDPKGDGKMSIRGGFAVFYESTLYNPLSNSRWNLPFYSFNEASPYLGVAALPVYGPTNADGTPNTSEAPTYSGPPNNLGQGPAGSGFQGNIMGWDPANPNLAALTGIPDPSMRTPYMENAFFGIQREISPSTVLEVNWVGTFGHKLFWAENPNRVVGGKLRDPSTITNPCTGVSPTAPTGVINPCFGRLRTWKNSVNSSYNALQASLTRKMSKGIAFTTNYTWSHSLDYRSSWQALSSGGSATEANPFGSAGYAMDPARLYLERGNSIFDVKHRFVTSLQWELPWLKAQHGAVGKAFGGWQANTIVSIQSGFPFTVGARRDYNGDGISNDRPNTPSWGNFRSFSNTDFLQGSGPAGALSLMNSLQGDFPTPAPGTDGNLGRNTFRGPGLATVDFSLFKTIPFNERIGLQFRAEFFNLFNRVNLYPPEANLTASAFGLAQQALDPRVIQFGLKLNF